VAEHSDIVVTMVTSSPDVEAVTFGPDGIAEGAHRPSGGLLVIDMSSISPVATRAFAERADEKGFRTLDAPVSGGEIGAVEARLSIMVGGEEDDVERARPLFEALGKTIIHIGGHGAGQACKLANQIAVAINNLGVSEALVFASAMGIDLERTRQVIAGGAGSSWAMQNYAPKMLAGDFKPGFMVDHQQKDLRNVLDAARALAVQRAAARRWWTRRQPRDHQGHRAPLGHRGPRPILTFDESLARLAVLSDADLLRPAWTFRGKPSEIGYALYHAIEEEQRAAIDAPPSATEAARILSVAQSAFGELRGLLAGLDDVLLDRVPGSGEWSLRETLAHAIGVERSYRANTEYSLTRTASEPLLMPTERRPQPDPADTAGSVRDVVARFAQRRVETDASLAALDEAVLARPSMWGGFEVDVRHRLHRFASHIAEHTNQCEKAVRALDAFGGDARSIVKRIGTLRGLHERRTDPARLQALDAALDEKVRATGA